VEEELLSVFQKAPMTMNDISISLKNAGKRFNREWIFKALDYEFKFGNAYAITGFNGSGKSTLLQCIAGSMAISEGKIEYKNELSKSIPAEIIYKDIAYCAPYLELVEEMTTIEMLQFHESFKPFFASITIPEIIEVVGLERATNKQIRNFSSGMKQRLRLAQAIFSDCPILLLDEPCSNLDKEGYQLYYQLINKYCSQKLLIICSNEEAEIEICSARLNIVDYK
jgi:ABC-type multidrug transport system ATPase subunit